MAAEQHDGPLERPCNALTALTLQNSLHSVPQTEASRQGSPHASAALLMMWHPAVINAASSHALPGPSSVRIGTPSRTHHPAAGARPGTLQPPVPRAAAACLVILCSWWDRRMRLERKSHSMQSCGCGAETEPPAVPSSRCLCHGLVKVGCPCAVRHAKRACCDGPTSIDSCKLASIIASCSHR